jgi:cyclic pyranopterin phosphate synthase
VRETLEQHFNLLPSTHRTGGPARYCAVEGTSTRVGFISPLTSNFCASCNRVRVSASGKLYMCLGHEDNVDLRAALRGTDPGALDALLDRAIGAKPERHEFDLGFAATQRHMSVTGG